jgi:hypothetical protein
VLWGFRWSAPCAARLPERRRRPFQRVWSVVDEQLGIGANHSGMMSLARRFVTDCGEESAPLVGA